MLTLTDPVGRVLGTAASTRAAGRKAVALAREGTAARVTGEGVDRLYRPEWAAAPAGGRKYRVPCACGGWRWPAAATCNACRLKKLRREKSDA